MKTRYMLPLIPFLFTLWSCTSSNPEAKSTLESNLTEDLKNDSIIEYCYRMEQPFENEEGRVDQLEMRLIIKADEVTGHYNWLPVYKDHRQGTIVGTLHDSIILANYYFEQEGIRDTAGMKIVLKKNGIAVSSDRKELGLDATLPLVECKDTEQEK
ncbi:MAG: hypothetical protein KUL83_04120 [Lentimicrobium sp.]|nr:hypothetical protein [Lentimicrobium sp.]MDD2526626.1 hypothetical protein [Lentimicrobiaceae bacterium]MDD4596810.1 hypothetical protein [Lentimicrobiaceae bacterium]MDY0026529.1 hypothetical protein [Lentimicrobium sp.]